MINQKYKIIHAVRLNDGLIELQAEVLCTACGDGIFIPTQKFLVVPGEIPRFNETKLFCGCGNGFSPKIPTKTGGEFYKDFHRRFENCEEVFGTLQHEITHFFCGEGRFVPIDAEALECFREETRKADGFRKPESKGRRRKEVLKKNNIGQSEINLCEDFGG